MIKVSVKTQVEAKVGESVYSTDDIHHLMYKVGLERVPSVAKIRAYAKEHDLGVTPEQFGIRARFLAQRKGYYIKSSNLDKLVEGLGIPVTAEQLEQATFDTRYGDS